MGLKQIVLLGRYSVWGVMSFALELALLYVLLNAFTLPYLVGVPLAFVITTTVFWLSCHCLVFARSRRRALLEYELFFGILLSGLLLATVIVFVLVYYADLDVITARLVSGVFTGLWDFYLNARYNFRAHAFLRR